ncbi:MAG: FAD-dependent 5-carboxymethylaminomethyl-2-thiouridine(34) oxidoreductase MnmC, partial [Gammaproteobacteria bacterium]|nr:FAD-dependent 5-carboxymethylaminomethyl-2-thiouridine(34) oxidoreductase MnmC [Gammaproteobacteria bacterium]
AAGQVKRNLLKAGFTVDKVAGYGKKREMLVACFNAIDKPSLKFSDEPWFCQPTMINVKVKKATVIGAGIAGLSVAYALVKRGWFVTVIEKHTDIAKEASANPAAIVYPRLSLNNDIDTEFYTAAYCYSLYVLKSLQLKTKEKFWFATGVLQLFENKRITAIIEKFQFNSNFVKTVGFVSVNKNRVGGIPEPALANNVDTYVDYQSAGVVLPGILCNAIKNACGHRLEIITADISDIKNTLNKHQVNSQLNKQWLCYSADKLINQSEVLIIANGAGSNTMSINNVKMKTEFPVDIVRGQVSVFDENANSKKLQETFNAEVYVTPSIHGKHYVGATYSRASTKSDIDKEDKDVLFTALNNVCPDIFKQTDYSDAWVGFRSMSEDRVAIVGAMPNTTFFSEEYKDLCHGKQNKNYRPACYEQGLYLSVAHGSRGFTSSFLCAEIIAAQIEGEPMPVSKKILNYLSPSRFVVKKLRRQK